MFTKAEEDAHGYGYPCASSWPLAWRSQWPSTQGLFATIECYFFCFVAIAERSRKDDEPVSMILELKVIRSTTAPASLGSLKIPFHLREWKIGSNHQRGLLFPLCYYLKEKLGTASIELKVPKLINSQNIKALISFNDFG